LKDNKKFQNYPQIPRVRVIDRLPLTTWNSEDFIVPSRKKKPLQVSWAMMPELPEVKDLAIAKFMARQGMLILLVPPDGAGGSM